MNITKKIFLPIIIALSISNVNIAVAIQIAEVASSDAELMLIQVLKDGINGVDGLDNPRTAKVAIDNSQVFVASGDDNSFAVFNLDNNFKLSFSQIFKNAAPEINGLEGASGVTFLKTGNKVFVASFYDGALSIFSRDNNRYQLSKTISDRLSYERVFSSETPVAELDSLGLLGAWEVVSSFDDKQLLIASYKSNSVSIFDITPDEQVVFNRFIKNGMPLVGGLGNPVDLTLSPSNDELFVLGFEGHQLTIFDRDKDGNLSAKQVLQNGVNGVNQFLNPQKLVVSPNGKFLYVACSGSNTLVVFNKAENGSYAFLQAITNSEIGGSGLNGAGSLAISLDGSRIYAAGEADVGLFLFKTEPDGRLKFMTKFLNEDNPIDEFKGISSINLTSDGRHLLLTSAKNDSLFVFKRNAD